jgi:ZIP family zinc transporter
MREALLAAALTGLATGLGAFPFFFVRALPRRMYDGILGLGAGLMLAAATLGLLTEALSGLRTAEGFHTGHLLWVLAGFISGVGIAAVMDRFIPHRHARGHHEHIAHDHAEERHDLSIHRVPEGVAIGAGFVASENHRLGILLSAAVALQNVCEGVVMGAPLRVGGVSPARGLLIVLLTGSAVPLGALVGHVVSSAAIAGLPFVLALAAGTLIYVTSNEIIPESHSHGHEATASTGVVAGFLITMLISAVVR